MGAAVLAFVATVMLITTAAAQDASRIKPGQVPVVRSQEEGRQTPAIQVQTFGGRGGSSTPPVDMSLPSPVPLSAAQLAAIAKTIGVMTAPGTPYARVSASEPNAANRAALVFVLPAIVEGGQGWVKFEGTVFSNVPAPSGGRAVLWLHAPTARDFFVDCTVTGGGEFEVRGPDSTQTFDFGEEFLEGHHIVFMLQAAEPGWYSFEIEQTGDPLPTIKNLNWRLYACEITNL